MNYQPINKILISSDGNILQYQRTIPKSKVSSEDLFVYVFVVSEFKKGMEMTFTKSELEKSLRNNFKVIE